MAKALETPAVVGPYAMAGWVDPSILEEIEEPVTEDLLQAESIEDVLPVRGISIGD